MSIGAPERPWPRGSGRHPGRSIVLVAVALGVALHVAALNPALAQTTEISAWQATPEQMATGAAVWHDIPAVEVPLTAQQATLPIGGGSIPMLRVKALHSEGRIYLHLGWDDATNDDRTDAVEAFADAVAVQLPAAAGTAVPAICMGQIDQGVNIWHWRADSEHELPSLPADSYVDVPAAHGDLDFPARVAGNPMALADAGSVQNLVAGGFGTLEPAPSGAVAAVSEYAAAGWEVVFERALDAPAVGQPGFAVQATTDIVFAVWNGSEGDRDGQKSVSAFVTLRLVTDAPPSPAGTYLVVALALVGVLAVIGVGSYLASTPSPAARRR